MRAQSLGAVTVCVFGLGGCSLWEDATTVDVPYDVELVEPVTMDGTDAVQPATLDVAVSTASPTSTPTISQAGKWGPMLRANQVAEDADAPRLFTIAVEGTPTFTGTAPVQFAIDVSSGNDVVWGDTLNPTPQDVASCTFILDPSTAAPGDFGTGLENCLVDWADTNGIPAELAFSVTASSTVTAHGPTDEFDFVGVYVMETTSPIDIDCETEVALPSDVIDRLETITFGDASLDAVGTAEEGSVGVAWFGAIFDSNGAVASAGFGYDALTAGESRDFHAVVTAEDPDGTISGDANVTLIPDFPDEFLDATINALAGTETGDPGSGMACWFSAGDVPRSGTLAVAINGVAAAGL